MLGNSFTDPEGSAKITFGEDVWRMGSPLYATFIRKAGSNLSNMSSYILPYVVGSASYGEPNPIGDNPVITTADNGSGTLDLNIGGRTWRAGISPQHGTIIQSNFAS